MEKFINKILSNKILVITFALLIFAIADVNRWLYILAPISTYSAIFTFQLISIFLDGLDKKDKP